VTDPIDSVVYVRVDGDDACLGSVLGASAVLVAGHCLLDDASRPLAPSRVLVVDQANARFSVRSVAVLDPNGAGESVQDFVGRDLGILRIQGDLGARAAPLEVEDHAGLWAVTGLGGELEVTRVAPRAMERDQIFTAPVTCDGDSGGPLFDDRGAIVGVASWRTPGRCGTGASVFTRTLPHLAWIRSVTSEGRSD
jgi:secreted trypsin-like serine protease